VAEGAATIPLVVAMGGAGTAGGATAGDASPVLELAKGGTGGGGNGASGRRGEPASDISAAPRVLFAEPSPGKPGTAAVGFLLALPSSFSVEGSGASARGRGAAGGGGTGAITG
jgi:hypothetical protein